MKAPSPRKRAEQLVCIRSVGCDSPRYALFVGHIEVSDCVNKYGLRGLHQQLVELLTKEFRKARNAALQAAANKILKKMGEPPSCKPFTEGMGVAGQLVIEVWSRKHKRKNKRKLPVVTG